MRRQELFLWTTSSAESIFLYYFVGTLTLLFLITVFITRALRRRQPRVTELFSSEDYNGPSVPYLVAITTSSGFGCGCPDRVKVFMQLIGDRNVSPYFTLRGKKGGIPLLKRGFTDIFLVNVKESMGRIAKVKLVLLGADSHIKWLFSGQTPRTALAFHHHKTVSVLEAELLKSDVYLKRISHIQLYNPRTGRKRDIETIVTIAETLGEPELDNVLKYRSCFDCVRNICVYHQWLSNISNSVRFGAFSDVVHVLLLFTSILTLLFLSLILYISLPRSETADDETFELNYLSLVIGSTIDAFACFSICFSLEMIIRNVRSRENNLTYAYFSLKEKKKDRLLQYCQFENTYSGNIKTNEPEFELGQRDSRSTFISDEEDENKTFVLKYSASDNVHYRNKRKKCHEIVNVSDSEIAKSLEVIPSYLKNLITNSLSSQHSGEHRQGDHLLEENLSLALINSSTFGIHSVQKISNLSLAAPKCESALLSFGEEIDEVTKETTDLRDSIFTSQIPPSVQVMATSDSRFGTAVVNRLSNYLSSELNQSKAEIISGIKPSEESVISIDIGLPSTMGINDSTPEFKGIDSISKYVKEAHADKRLTADGSYRKQSLDITEEEYKIDDQKYSKKPSTVLPYTECLSSYSDYSPYGSLEEVSRSNVTSIQAPSENITICTMDFDGQKRAERQKDARVGGQSRLSESSLFVCDDMPDHSNVGTFSGKLVLNRDTNDVKVEIDPETVQDFDEELDNFHRQNRSTYKDLTELTLDDTSMSSIFRSSQSEIIDLRSLDESEQKSKQDSQNKAYEPVKSECYKKDVTGDDHPDDQREVMADEDTEDSKQCQGLPSECQTVWIQIKIDILLVFIWVQTDCKGYWQTTKLSAGMQRVITESQGFDEQDGGDLRKDVEFISHGFKSKKCCRKFENSVKNWARSFVHDMFLKFKSYRDSTAEGYLTYEMTWQEMFSWIHDVVFKITVCMVYRSKQDLCKKASYKSVEVQNLLAHSAAELIVLAIDGVSHLLEQGDQISPPDLFLTSHIILQGITQVSSAIIYTMDKIEHGELEEEVASTLRLIDVEANVKYVARKFLRDCARWTFQQGSLSWPFIKRLIPTAANEDIDDTDKISSLAILASTGGLESYNDLQFVVTKLAEYVIEDSQSEVWTEFQNQQLVFTDILMKLRILECLQKKIYTLERKKRFVQSLIDNHDKPKSRVQKRMEKRLEMIHMGDKENQADKTGEEKKKKKKSWKDEISNLEYKDWLREVGSLVGPLIGLCKIHLILNTRWRKQGLKLHMKAALYLAQTLLHPNIAISKEDCEGYWFENFLHFKRAENTLMMFLIGTVDDLVKIITHDAIEAALASNPINAEMIEDLVVKADISSRLLVNEEQEILDEVMKLEELHEEAISGGIEMHLLAHDFTGNMETNSLNIKQNALTEMIIEPSEVEINIAKMERPCSVMLSDEMISCDDEDIADENLEVEDILLEEDQIQSMLTVLKPLKTYIAYIQKEELLHNRYTLKRYIEKSEKKRQRVCSLNYQHVLDSFYIIEEDEDNPAHTKESLYQLEHDFMEETNKPLPGVVKTLLIWIMMIMIGFNLLYVGLVAGQLSTTETQEWICYYLLSVIEFALLLEPIRAILIGYIVSRPM